MYWKRTRRLDRWGTNAAWFFDRVPSFDGDWDFGKVGSRSELVFFLLLHYPYHRTPLYDFRSSGNGSILWALLDCHTLLWRMDIFDFILQLQWCEAHRRNSIAFTFLLIRHTHSNPLMSVFSVLYNNTLGKLSEDFFLTTFKASIGLFHFLYL